jgi:hypothetical protein
MAVSGDFAMEMIAPVFFEMIFFFKMVSPSASLNALDFSVQSQLEAEPMAKPPSYWNPSWIGQPMMEVLSRWYAVTKYATLMPFPTSTLVVFK